MPTTKDRFANIFGHEEDFFTAAPTLSEVVPTLIDKGDAGGMSSVELSKSRASVRGGRASRVARTRSAEGRMPAEIADRMGRTTIFDTPITDIDNAPFTHGANTGYAQSFNPDADITAANRAQAQSTPYQQQFGSQLISDYFGGPTGKAAQGLLGGLAAYGLGGNPLIAAGATALKFNPVGMVNTMGGTIAQDLMTRQAMEDFYGAEFDPQTATPEQLAQIQAGYGAQGFGGLLGMAGQYAASKLGIGRGPYANTLSAVEEQIGAYGPQQPGTVVVPGTQTQPLVSGLAADRGGDGDDGMMGTTYGGQVDQTGAMSAGAQVGPDPSFYGAEPGQVAETGGGTDYAKQNYGFNPVRNVSGNHGFQRDVTGNEGGFGGGGGGGK
jgi:hypothetical protein